MAQKKGTRYFVKIFTSEKFYLFIFYFVCEETMKCGKHSNVPKDNVRIWCENVWRMNNHRTWWVPLCICLLAILYAGCLPASNTLYSQSCAVSLQVCFGEHYYYGRVCQRGRNQPFFCTRAVVGLSLLWLADHRLFSEQNGSVSTLSQPCSWTEPVEQHRSTQLLPLGQAQLFQ